MTGIDQQFGLFSNIEYEKSKLPFQNNIEFIDIKVKRLLVNPIKYII